MEEIIAYVLSNKADLVIALLALLGAASDVAKLTPTEADNKVLAVILKVVHALGLTKS